MSTPPVNKRGRKVPYKADKGIHATAPNSDINVTPLVDVCLVLLIIFMVVTPMLGRGRDVRLPVIVEASQHKEGDQVFVSVDDQGAWIETTQYLERTGFLGALHESLKVAAGKAAANGSSGPLLFIKGDRETDYGKVRTVMEWINSDPATQQPDIALVVDLPE
jgi:biopolymer transport protein ExbD